MLGGLISRMQNACQSTRPTWVFSWYIFVVSVPNLYPCNAYVYCTWWTSTCIRCTLSNNVAKVSLRLEGGSRVEVRSWVRRYRSISSIFSNSNLTQNGTVEKFPMKALKYFSNGNTWIKLRSGGSGSRGIELVTLGSGFLGCHRVK